MSSDCCKKPEECDAAERARRQRLLAPILKMMAGMFPTRADIDEIRVWKLTFHFADGTSRKFEGDNAFWGTGENARKLAGFTAQNFDSIGKKVSHWETERDDNG